MEKFKTKIQLTKRIKVKNMINMKKLIFLGVLSVIILIMPVHATEPTEPHNANAMWIEPSQVNIPSTVGYKFNVTVWINLTTTCGTWEFKLIYDKTYLNATRCGYTAGGQSEFFKGLTTIPLSPTYGSVNSTHNYVLYAEAILMSPYRSPGYGSLAWVEFEVIATPPQGQTITTKLDISTFYPDETYAQDDTGTKITLDNYNANVIIPEFSMLILVITLITATSMLIYLRRNRKY